MLSRLVVSLQSHPKIAEVEGESLQHVDFLTSDPEDIFIRKQTEQRSKQHGRNPGLFQIIFEREQTPLLQQESMSTSQQIPSAQTSRPLLRLRCANMLSLTAGRT
eukprot:752968-Hanusia_phi.AAC.1